MLALIYLHRLFLVPMFQQAHKTHWDLLWISFSNKFMCSTRSNTFEASKNTACTDEPWVTKYEAVCFNKNSHWSVLWPDLKPNWLSVVPRKGEMLDNMKCSSSFDPLWLLPLVCNLMCLTYSHSCFWIWELLLCFNRNWVYTREHRAGLRGGNGGNCPGPSAPRGPPVLTLFVLNKILVWKIVIRDSQEIQEYNSIFRCCLLKISLQV